MGDKIPILVIEDEADLRILLKAVLEDTKYDMLSVESMRAATHAMANGHGFRLVLCDLSLPDSDPNETIPAMIQMAKGAPVVAMTGWTDDATQAMIRRQGVSAVLLKGDTCLCRDLEPFLDRILGL